MKRVAAALVAAVILGAPRSSADSSVAGTFVNLEFSGRLRADVVWWPESVIDDQVRYTIGQLNGYGGGAQVAGVRRVLRSSSRRAADDPCDGPRLRGVVDVSDCRS